MCFGACPAALVINGGLSGMSRVALQMAMGGPKVKFSEIFKFHWVDWGCIKFIDPIFAYNNR